MKPSQAEYKKQLKDESICPECNIEMDIEKHKKKNHFDKERTIYKCYICGITHRKRTQNEILRDMGCRD